MGRNRINDSHGRRKVELQGTQIELSWKGGHKKRKLNGGAINGFKRKCKYEFQEQISAVHEIRKLGFRVHHSPNGGVRDAREGAKFKAMGTSAGWPDLILPYARKGYHGLLIEVKPVKGGELTELQKEWGAHLIKEGYAWYEARGAEEVLKIVFDYFGIT